MDVNCGAKVVERLWCLDDEYEKLKAEITDHKVMLAALKQQAELLVTISRQESQEEEINEWEGEYDPNIAAKELRELFTKLQPMLVN